MKARMRTAWAVLALVAAVVVPLRITEIHQAYEARQAKPLVASLPANR